MDAIGILTATTGLIPLKYVPLGTRLGLVVIGDDSCLRGRELESRRCILDGHVSH